MTKGKVSERERRFVECYMGKAAGNATVAAKLAGYSEKTARQQGNRLLTKAAIREAIAKRVDSDPKVATREERQRFWSDLMNGDGAFALASYADRLRASELLGKSQADFIERHEVKNVSGSVTVVVRSARKPA